MKKLFTFLCLVSFFNLNAGFAIEEVIPLKKDPGLIKLPNNKKLDRKAFEIKMAQDEKEYQKKITGLSNNYTLYRDEKGKIIAKFGNDSISEEEKEYKDIQNSWTQGYYMFYKTADKIIRANNLDTQNWRFMIDKKPDEINAYSTAANLVAINSSLVDSFYENEDALAFVIGHEMAHHIFNHAQLSKKAYDRIRKLDIGIYNSIVWSFLIFPLPFIPAYYIRKHIWYKRLRQAELSADTEGLSLMTRAGYDADYANDVMSTLIQVGEHEKNYRDTHPKHKQRLENLNKQMALLDVNLLKSEGENNLFEKPVLVMKRSSDKNSIVLIPQNNRGSVYYSKITPQQKIIYKAYSAYLNDDMTKSALLFEQAYNLDKKNFIPCLYLSYINEYNYQLNKNEISLKQAKIWADRAYKKRNTDKYTLKQKMDIEMLTKTK